MYECESWTVKKAERPRIDTFELWCWRRLLRVPWTARRANQSILKEISPEYSFKGLMLPDAKNWLLGKVMTNLDSIFTLPTKVCLVKAMVFPVVMYGCESETIKKAEHQRIDAFELCCWRRLLRIPWTARRSNRSILKISPECSLEDWCWSWNSNTLATWCEELTH